MKFPRRRLLHLMAAAAALPVVPRIAKAQDYRNRDYPNRYVRLVVPFPPGGGGDAIGRPLANRLSEVSGRQVVIENKGGAGGNIGSQAVAQAAPDGYTLLLGGPFLAINPWLYPSSGYDPVADLAPATLVTVIANLMMVPNSSPARSVKEFIDYAESNPRQGHVRLDGNRRVAPPQRRAVQTQGRHQDDPRALSRGRPRHERPDPRPRRCDVQQPARRAPAGAKRDGARIGRDLGQSLARRAGHPGDCGDRAGI